MKLYQLVLRLCPAAFRTEYGAEVLELVRARRRELGVSASSWVRAGFWLRELLALVRAGLVLWARRLWGGKEGGRSMRDSLHYRSFRPEGSGPMRDVWKDVRLVVRRMTRERAFTAAVVATLALGIGATTAIFSAVHGSLLRPLPYEDPDRIILLWQTDPGSAELDQGVSVANLEDWRRESRSFSALALAEPWGFDNRTDVGTETLDAWLVTPGFFEAAGARPVLGRSFLPEEYAAGGSRVVMLSYGAWRGRFGGDAGLIGRTLELDGEPAVVVGVLPAWFRLPAAAEAWAPRPPRAHDEQSRRAAYHAAIGRLAPGVTPEQAEAELNRLMVGLAEQYPAANEGVEVRVKTVREHLVGQLRPALLVLMGAVVLVLLIACVNVAGLLLARGSQREREQVVRSALGASRGRLIRETLVESGVLAVVGCLAGLVLAQVGIRAILSLRPASIAPIEPELDPVVLAFALVVSAAAALLFGGAPALRLSRPDLMRGLSDGAPGRSTAGARQRGLRSALVVGEVALAVVLAVGAGLLVRSFTRLTDNEIGFQPENLVVAQIFAYGYPDAAARRAFLERAVENIGTLPGVRSVGRTSDVPFAGDGDISRIDILVRYSVEGRPVSPGDEPSTSVVVADSGYFQALGIDLIEGRLFGSFDRSDTEPVALIDRAMADRGWPGESPVGRRVTPGYASQRTWTVVGVVENVRTHGYDADPQPHLYLPLSQQTSGPVTFVVRADTDAGSLVEAVRRQIWAANPAQAIGGVTTMETLLGEAVAERRFLLVLLSVFAGVAVLLAGVGIYGLIAFTAGQRRNELGIRLALGGRRLGLTAMIVGQGLRLALLGVVLGLAGALGVAGLLRGMLYGVAPTDPVTLTLLPLGILALAAAASYVPARRALRIDPARALRAE